MNIVVFGSSGKVGRLVVQTALERKHGVRAFVRSHNPFTGSDGLEIVHGDIADVAAVDQALHGMDAAISTLGGWGKGDGGVLQTGMRVLIPAMGRVGISRIVTITGAGAHWAGDTMTLQLRLNRMILGLISRAVLPDGEAHLEELAASGLEWTTVRAPTITPSGSDVYRLEPRVPSLMATIPGPAVARCMVELVERPAYSRQAPGIHRK